MHGGGCGPRRAGGVQDIVSNHMVATQTARRAMVHDVSELPALEAICDGVHEQGLNVARANVLAVAGQFEAPAVQVPDSRASAPIVSPQPQVLRGLMAQDLKRKMARLEEEEEAYDEAARSASLAATPTKKAKVETLSVVKIANVQKLQNIATQLVDAVELNGAKREDYSKLLDSRITEDLGAKEADFNRKDAIVKAIQDSDDALREVLEKFKAGKLDKKGIEDLEAVEAISAHMEEVNRAVTEFKKKPEWTHARDSLAAANKFLQEIEKRNKKSIKTSRQPSAANLAGGNGETNAVKNAKSLRQLLDDPEFPNTIEHKDMPTADGLGEWLPMLLEEDKGLQAFMKDLRVLVREDGYYKKAKVWVESHMKQYSLTSSYAAIMKPAFDKQVGRSNLMLKTN